MTLCLPASQREIIFLLALMHTAAEKKTSGAVPIKKEPLGFHTFISKTGA
jgi:hypothetical protein